MSAGAKIGVALTMAFVVLVAVGGTAYVSTQRLLEANRLVIHTQYVQEKLEDVIAVHVDAETGQRGFIITGEERYLEPYNAALGRIQKDIETLTSLTRDNAEQQDSLLHVQKLSDAKLDELRETIRLRRESGFEGALPVIISDRGKKIMDDLRDLVTKMSVREQTLLDERTAAANASARYTVGTIAVWMPLAMVILTIIAVILMRTVRFDGAAARPAASGKAWIGVAVRYGSAVIIIAVATVLRWRLITSFGPMPTFITFYPAILLVASIGGGGPGILATLLSALAADYWFIEPYGQFGIGSTNDAVALGIFIGVNLFLCVLAERCAGPGGPRPLTSRWSNAPRNWHGKTMS